MKRRDIVWNLLGLSLPLLLAVVTIPSLINVLGKERFGVIAIAWGMINYAGILDLGIGRAATQLIARNIGLEKSSTIPNIVTTAGRITIITSMVGAIFIVFASFAGAAKLLKVSTIPYEEIQNCLYLMAIVLPFQALGATYKGVNQAFHKFIGINIVQITLGAINFLGPFILAIITKNIFWLLTPLVVSRLLALLIYRRLAWNCVSNAKYLSHKAFYSKSIALSLFKFGGWATVSAVVGPLMLQSDRLLIGVMVSAGAVTSYVLPYEVTTQALLLVGAVTIVIFPTLSQMVAQGDETWRPFFNRWLFFISSLMFILCVILYFILPILLQLWLKQSCNTETIAVSRILCFGVFANSIGCIYYALYHAKGRADITAKIHLLEFPIYILVLCSLISVYGIIGAAWGWVIRVTFDAMALSYLSRQSK